MDDKQLRDEFEYTRNVVRERTVGKWFYFFAILAFLGLLMKACGG